MAGIELLQSIPIFSDLAPAELEHLVQVMRERKINAGEVLFHEGDPGEELYIICTGKVGVRVKLPDGDDLEISEITAGQFFGEMSIFERAPRSATCAAKDETSLWSLHTEDFHGLIKSDPNLAGRIMYRMLNITAARLRNTGNFLADMVQWGEAARKRAVTDDFTGLYNRRFLEDALESQFSQAEMKKQPLCMAMVDLDHFGALNKDYGEALCDEILLKAVEVFRAVFDETDILVRYGGDEFIFIMPDTTPKIALKKCSQVCEELAALDVLAGREGTYTQVTSSIGVAGFPEHAATRDELRDKADAAVYRAKDRGRNCAVFPE